MQIHISAAFLITLQIGYYGSASLKSDIANMSAQYNHGRYVLAEYLGREILKKDPANPAAHYLMGNVYYKLRDTKSAASQYNYCIQTPDKAVARLAGAALSRMTKNESAAHSAYIAKGAAQKTASSEALKKAEKLLERSLSVLEFKKKQVDAEIVHTEEFARSRIKDIPYNTVYRRMNLFAGIQASRDSEDYYSAPNYDRPVEISRIRASESAKVKRYIEDFNAQQKAIVDSTLTEVDTLIGAASTGNTMVSSAGTNTGNTAVSSSGINTGNTAVSNSGINAGNTIVSSAGTNTGNTAVSSSGINAGNTIVSSAGAKSATQAFSACGIDTHKEMSGQRVITVSTASPGHRGGLMPGDLIEHFTLNQSTDLLRLTIRRGDKIYTLNLHPGTNATATGASALAQKASTIFPTSAGSNPLKQPTSTTSTSSATAASSRTSNSSTISNSSTASNSSATSASPAKSTAATTSTSPISSALTPHTAPVQSISNSPPPRTGQFSGATARGSSQDAGSQAAWARIRDSDIVFVQDMSNNMRLPLGETGLSKADWCGARIFDCAETIARNSAMGFTLVQCYQNSYELARDQNAVGLRQRFGAAKAEPANLSTPLQYIAGEYFESHSQKPLLILVLTDGHPERGESLEAAVKAIVEKATSADQVRIIFFQIGDDAQGTAALQMLDDDLTYVGHKYDIVDCVKFEDLQDLGLSRALLEAYQRPRAIGITPPPALSTALQARLEDVRSQMATALKH